MHGSSGSATPWPATRPRTAAPGGVAWLAARDDDVAAGVAGVLTRGEPEPVRRDSIFRIASMTKPIVAVGGADPRRGVPAAARRPGRRPAARAGRPAGAGRRPGADRRRDRPGRPADHGARRPHVPARAGAWTSRRRGRSRCSRRWASSASAAARPSRRCRPEPDEWMRRLVDAAAALPAGRAVAVQHRLRRARRAGRPGRRPAARGVPAGAGVRAARHGRHRLLHLRTSTASAPATRVNPETGERVVLRPARRPVGQAPGLPVRRRRPRVDARRRARASRRMLLAGGRLPDGSRLLSRAVGRGDDHRPDRRRAGRAPARRPTGRRAGASASASRCAGRARPAPSAATAGPAASARRGPTTRASGLVGVVLTTDMFTGAVPAAGRHPGLLDLRLRRPRRLGQRPGARSGRAAAPESGIPVRPARPLLGDLCRCLST